MKKNINKKGFSILIAILMTGFLLILVIGMFNLMIRDMKDNRGSDNYTKAYAGAEGAMELGLLKIKEKGYGVDNNLEKSNILSFNDTPKVNDSIISYNMDIGTKEYSGKIGTGATVIIPLFSNDISVKKPNLSITNNNEGDIIWNIVGKGEGMSGTGGFTNYKEIYYKQKTGNNNTINYKTETIETFLDTNTGSYLMLFNKSSNSEIEYTLKSGKNFSKPVGTITSSVQVGKFRQNITTNIDNTEFLKMLKYSLYSK